jgi:hypothetical protein
MHDHEIDKGKGEMENLAGKANQQAPESPMFRLAEPGMKESCHHRDHESGNRAGNRRARQHRNAGISGLHPGIKETENASHRAGDEAAQRSA